MLTFVPRNVWQDVEKKDGNNSQLSTSLGELKIANFFCTSFNAIQKEIVEGS